jgi:hypothetical protein
VEAVKRRDDGLKRELAEMRCHQLAIKNMIVAWMQDIVYT